MRNSATYSGEEVCNALSETFLWKNGKNFRLFWLEARVCSANKLPAKIRFFSGM
jgi:hypothetical protein